MSLDKIIEVVVRNSSRDGKYRLCVDQVDREMFERKILSKFPNVEKEYVYFGKQYYIISRIDLATLLRLPDLEISLGVEG